MWRMYDSNTSRKPTASDRRGLEATRGDLKARAWAEQDALTAAICPSVWPTAPFWHVPMQQTFTSIGRHKRCAGIHAGLYPI